MGRRLRFCLVTPAHVCNNPRLVKEADALDAAGHRVRVVSLVTSSAAMAHDFTVMATRGWNLQCVDARRETTRMRWLGWSAAQRAARLAFDAGLERGLVRDLAASRFVVPLALAAASDSADVYVAHNLEALPAAAWAAQRHGARLAFDVEDLYEGILPDDRAFAAERRRIRRVQERYLPRCTRLTAAAPAIGEEIATRYGVMHPVTILNAFPTAERAFGSQVRRDRRSDAPSLYWFSQTLGPDRGVEDALAALELLDVPAHLYLRGAVRDDYRRELTGRAERAGLGERLHFLGVVPPGEIVSRAAEHDIGLALEQPTTLNRDICVTNKLFVYMLAGLAVVATETRGQRDLLLRHDTGARLYPPGDAAALAAALRALLRTPGALEDARARAFAAACGPFAWEHEAERLVGYLTDVGTPPVVVRNTIAEALA